MASLSQLETRVRNLVLDETQVVLDRVDDEIRAAQRELEDDHVFLVMEDEQEITTVEGARTHANYAKPADYLRSLTTARPVVVDGIGEKTKIDWLIRYGDRNDLYSDNPLQTGMPQHVYERDEDWEIFPYPNALAPGGALFADGNWRIRIGYAKRLPSLSTPGSTNWFSDNAEDALVYMAAVRGLKTNRDWEEAALMGVDAEKEKRIVKHRDRMRRVFKQRLLRPMLGARGSAFQPRRVR